jgi:hypothetical protein
MQQIINQSLIPFQSLFNKVSTILYRFLKDYNMKKSLHLIVLIFLLGVGKLFAQDALAMASPEDAKKPGSITAGLTVFEFRASSHEYDLRAIPNDMVEQNFLGDLVSRKLYLLESRYTYQVSIVPGNPQTKTVVRKPVIYEAVQRIERHLKKSVKKGEISIETASIDFNKVLDIAYNILTVDTESFEKAISKTDDVVSLTNLFTKQVNLLF